MKRGVFQLLKEEIGEALLSVPETQKDSQLTFKLKSALNSPDPRVSIQVDENELDILLDNLGIPSLEETSIKKSVRKKTRTYLYFLRNESLTVES